MNNQMLSIVIQALEDLSERYGLELGDGVSEATVLFGETGLLDSVGLVSLIVSVEQEIEDQFDVSVTLADERAMSQARSPFRTVGSLAEYASSLVAIEV